MDSTAVPGNEMGATRAKASTITHLTAHKQGTVQAGPSHIDEFRLRPLIHLVSRLPWTGPTIKPGRARGSSSDV